MSGCEKGVSETPSEGELVSEVKSEDRRVGGGLDGVGLDGGGNKLGELVRGEFGRRKDRGEEVEEVLPVGGCRGGVRRAK